MKNPEKINPNSQILHDKLYKFIKESIPVLKKHIDINSVPTISDYEYVDNKIVKNLHPNWAQLNRQLILDTLLSVSDLPSLYDIIKTCNEYEQFVSYNGMTAYMFNMGISFEPKFIPISFLKQLINSENGFKFRKRTFEELFYSLLKYTSYEKSLWRIVVPIDNFSIEPKLIKLGNDICLRRLTPQELVDLINRRHTLDHFHGLSPWFNTVLEIDYPSNFTWLNSNDPNFIERMNEQERNINEIKYRVNQEITTLRTYFKRQISSNTFVIDYSGWNSISYNDSGGAIVNLPWVKPYSFSPNKYSLKEMNRFRNFRNKFISIKDEKIQQRIYVAMRKLAFCIDRPYKADRITDCVAGLEGLLVDDKTEIKHKFSERISILLETNPIKRANLLEEMNYVYKLRSDIAHGSKVADVFETVVFLNKKPKKEDIENYNNIQKLEPKMMDLLHRVILICIDKKTTKFNWDSSLMGTKVKPF